MMSDRGARACRLGLAFALVLAGCWFAGCDDTAPRVITGEAMGARYHITLRGAGLADAGLQAEIAELFESIEQQASHWRPSSWVSRFNARRSTEPVDIPGHAWAMLTLGQRVHRDSGGALDLTTGALVDLWGFGAVPGVDEPTDAQVTKARAACGADKLVLDHANRTLAKTAPGLRLDFSAIAKGYAVDRIAELLDRRGCRDYLIAFGGEVRARGDGPGGDGWVVAIAPTRVAGRTPPQAVTLRDQSAATSGGGERRRTLATGQVVSHLIDPRTGRPAVYTERSVTVIADHAATADAWATALSLVPADGHARLADDAGLVVVVTD